jgi:hypothetical protein
MEAFQNALRCGLSKQVMTDPVVVITDSNSSLQRGRSYERDVLEKWLAENGDDQTRYQGNPNLVQLINLYHQML